MGDAEDLVPEILKIDLVEEEDWEICRVDVAAMENAEQRMALQNLVENYKPNRIYESDVKMKLTLRDEEPIYQSARRLSLTEKLVVNEQIDEWIEEGIVQPSASDYASPVVLVKKKDGSVRLCVDYRMLNKKVIKDRYPLPLIEDQLNLLQDARVFSTLDLKNGFFHVRMDELSRKYTAFIVPDGHYEFLRVPFGLCNSPAVFQRFINSVFRNLMRQGMVLAYMDDLIIPSSNIEDGVKKLARVLETASKAGFIINWRKCCFLQSRVEFLGHVVGGGRMRPSDRKTEAVRRFPEPASIRNVQSFLGLSGYFRKFIPGYSMIARPLTNLLKAGAQFHFDDTERDAFV